MFNKNQFSMNFTPFKSNQRISSIYGKTIPEWFRPDLKNNTLLRHILYRRHRGMNTFVLILGNVRSGKSWTGLKFCQLYSTQSNKRFNVDKQVSFTIPKFLRWSSENMDSCYLVDEIQLSMSSREWWSIQAKIFNQFCDIQGFRRNCAFFTLPNISYIDKHLRFLINYIIVTINQGFVAWYKVKMKHHLGKGWLSPMGTIKVSKPSKHVTNKYELMKKIFNDQHLKDSIELLDNLDTPTEKEILKERNLELTVKLKEQHIIKAYPL